MPKKAKNRANNRQKGHICKTDKLKRKLKMPKLETIQDITNIFLVVSILITLILSFHLFTVHGERIRGLQSQFTNMYSYFEDKKNNFHKAAQEIIDNIAQGNIASFDTYTEVTLNEFDLREDKILENLTNEKDNILKDLRLEQKRIEKEMLVKAKNILKKCKCTNEKELVKKLKKHFKEAEHDFLKIYKKIKVKLGLK